MKVKDMPKILGDMIFILQNFEDLEVADHLLMDAQTVINGYLERLEKKNE